MKRVSNQDTSVIHCPFLKILPQQKQKYFYVMKQKQKKVKSQQSLQMKPKAADSIYSTS